MKEKIKISLETEEISRLNEVEMGSAIGGAFTTTSSEICTATIGVVVDKTIDLITRLFKKEEKEEDQSSKIIVEGCCEIDPAYCYSYE